MTTAKSALGTRKHDAIARELEEIDSLGLLRKPRLIGGPIGPRVGIDGRDTLLFCSNDYLGLANHPAVKEAAKRAIDEHGAGSGASRLVAGTLSTSFGLGAAPFGLHSPAGRAFAGFRGPAGLGPLLGLAEHLFGPLDGDLTVPVLGSGGIDVHTKDRTVAFHQPVAYITADP